MNNNQISLYTVALLLVTLGGGIFFVPSVLQLCGVLISGITAPHNEQANMGALVGLVVGMASIGMAFMCVRDANREKRSKGHTSAYEPLEYERGDIYTLRRYERKLATGEKLIEWR